MHTTTKRRLWIAAGYLLTALLLSVALLSDLVLGDALEDLRTFVAGACTADPPCLRLPTRLLFETWHANALYKPA